MLVRELHEHEPFDFQGIRVIVLSRRRGMTKIGFIKLEKDAAHPPPRDPTLTKDGKSA